MRILLAGGGSGGSAVPVLAVAEELRRLEPGVQLLYVGTREGPERQLVSRADIPFAAARSGKLRRYLSGKNILDMFSIPLGVLQAFSVVRHFRPDAAFGAGGYASVPPLVATRALRVPILIHQQDVEPSLANRLLAPLASKVTITFPGSRQFFVDGKTVLTGNPVRSEILLGSLDRARRAFGLDPELPVVLATGGGTGALALNRLIAEAAPELTEVCQIIHLTGRGREVPGPRGNSRYHQFSFLAGEMSDALAAASLVISRAGLSTLTEIAAMGKPSLLVPLPDSHQRANARVFAQQQAAIVFQQEDLTPKLLAATVRDLLADPNRLAELRRNASSLFVPDASTRIAREVLAVAREHG